MYNTHQLSRRKVRKIFMGCITVVIALFVTVAYVDRYNPVLLSLGNQVESYGRGFQILNPFRDRTPEVLAQTFLDLFRKDCKAAISNLPHNTKLDICEREKEHPLIRWSIDARKDASPAHVRLRFRLTRYRSPEVNDTFSNRFWFDIEHLGSSWTVTNVDTFY